MQNIQVTPQDLTLPNWVPASARHYLEHTHTGQSIRALARANNCHPSTIMRQVRRFENRRDDPLIDDALRALSTQLEPQLHGFHKEHKTMKMDRIENVGLPDGPLTQSRIDQEAKRVLHRLCEQGAVMAVAREMETAVIVRETQDGDKLRTAVVDRDIAQAIALKDWVACQDPTARISRYAITNAGRAALRRLTARDENTALGFRTSGADIEASDAWDIRAIEGDDAPHNQMIESPLIGLARRRDKSGEPFLSRDLVAAGERLREDFEVAKMGRRVGSNVGDFLDHAPLDGAPKGTSDGLVRAQAALRDLGSGLSDVVYRCCCLLEGLEQTEKTMGWSARSGKIVLRIALHRLVKHYADQGKFAPMIG